MEHIRDPAEGPWTSFDMGDGSTFDFVFDVMATGYTEAFSMDLVRVSPGAYSPPHIDGHSHAFFIVEGAAEIVIDGTVHDVAKGKIACIPKGATHSIRNARPETLVMLTLYDPPRRRA